MKNDTTNGFPDFGELREVFGHYKASLRKDDLLGDHALDRIFAEAPARISSIRKVRMQWGVGIGGLAVVTLALFFVLTESSYVVPMGAIIQKVKPPTTSAQSQASLYDTTKKGMTAPWQMSAPKPVIVPQIFPYNTVAHESAVRRELVDIQLAGIKARVDTFYKGLLKKLRNPEDSEAVRRWYEGVRVTNAKAFERKKVPGIGWIVALKGRNVRIQGMEVSLTIDTLESKVRLSMCDIQLSKDTTTYWVKAENGDLASREALARLARGIRITNASEFKRKIIRGEPIITSGNQKEQVPGMNLSLSTD
jgi:hypothetical protein